MHRGSFFPTASPAFVKWEEDQELEVQQGGMRGKGDKAELRCVMHMYKLPTINVTTMYSKYVLTKNT